MNIQKIAAFLAIISTVALVGCANNRVASLKTNELSKSSTEQEPEDESANLSDEEYAALSKELEGYLLEVQERNAADLKDFLAANELAQPISGLKCWDKHGEETGIYLAEYLPDNPAFNLNVEDPLTGDQRNSIFVREAKPDSENQLILQHMKRDDSCISYQLEAGKTYELIVYVQNNAYRDVTKSTTVGTAHDVKTMIQIPKSLTVDNEEPNIQAVVSSEEFSGIGSWARLTCDVPVTLHWDEELCIYEATGEFTKSLSLDNTMHSGAIIGQAPGMNMYAVLAKYKGEYSAGVVTIYRLKFYVDAEQKEPKIPGCVFFDPEIGGWLTLEDGEPVPGESID